MNQISDLNDACFVEANILLLRLATTFEDELGRKPTVEEFSELLRWGLLSSEVELFHDAACKLTRSVKILVGKAARSTLTPGDTFAVPDRTGKYFVAIYLATNGRFGQLYGFFDYQISSPRPLDMDSSQLRTLGPPIYSGKTAVQSGEWIYLGAAESFLELFETNYPIYHAKHRHPHNESIGEFGAAEYIDGTMRQIDRSEAEAVGLLDNSYESCVLECDIPDVLRRRLAQSPRRRSS